MDNVTVDNQNFRLQRHRGQAGGEGWGRGSVLRRKPTWQNPGRFFEGLIGTRSQAGSSAGGREEEREVCRQVAL